MGVSDFKKLTERVKSFLQQPEMIRSEVMSLAQIEVAVLQSFEIDMGKSNSSSDSSSDSEPEEQLELNWGSDGV